MIDIADEYAKRKPQLKVWGEHVCDTITKQINLLPNAKKIIKIWPEYRVKELDSFLNKARNPKYSDPFNDITDQVGARIVVHLSRDAKNIQKAIQEIADWSISIDRDYEKQAREKPNYFDYQAIHLLVRPKRPINIGGFGLSENITCEVQIHNLLQHAFSETTHDSVYKGPLAKDPEINRWAARSMALIEAADDYLIRTLDAVDAFKNPKIELEKKLETLYIGLEIPTVFPSKLKQVNAFIIASLASTLPDTTWAKIDMWLQKTNMPSFIRRHHENNDLYLMPAIILIYFMLEHYSVQLKQSWPFLQEDLVFAHTDLGIAQQD